MRQKSHLDKLFVCSAALLAFSCGASPSAAPQIKQDAALAPPVNAANIHYGNENAGSV